MSTKIVLRRTALSRNGWLSLKDLECDFADSSQTGRPSTTTTDENIKAIEQLLFPDRQISIPRVADELNIAKTSGHRIVSEHLGMKKVCTICMLRSLTPLQRMNRVDCCEELLQESEADPTDFFARIVTGDEC